MGGAHGPARLHALRGPGWRLGERRLGADGTPAAAGTAGHLDQHGGDGAARNLQGPRWRSVAAGGSAARRASAWDQLDFFFKKGLGYANEMALRPQTLYGIADSPVGLAAWILDHDDAGHRLIARVFDGTPEGLSRDDILDNITMYWLTNTAVSSARLYWDNAQTSTAQFFDAKGVQIPVSVTVFPDEIYAAPRRWAERAYPDLIQYVRHPWAATSPAANAAAPVPGSPRGLPLAAWVASVRRPDLAALWAVADVRCPPVRVLRPGWRNRQTRRS